MKVKQNESSSTNLSLWRCTATTTRFGKPFLLQL
jgi:hypothetical protein